MLPYGRQSISDADIAAVAGVLRGDWITSGPPVEAYEDKLSQVIGDVPVVAVSSGTAALHCAYSAAGIGPGDEIITPPLTFVATQATAVALGASIAFADICDDTGNIDPAAVEAAITPRTKAIVAVDYAGHPADMHELRRIATRHSLLLIEDAAHSLGSHYSGHPVGSLADLTTFSFFPTKNITTAEGGAVASTDPNLLARVRLFANQGLVRDPAQHLLLEEGPWHQEVHHFGLNYRLSGVLAALGASQLERLNHFRRRRAKIKAGYDSRFSNVDGLRIPAQRLHVEPVWHLYPLRVPREKRKDIFMKLRDAGIGVQVNYIPAYWHPAFDRNHYPKGLCPVAEAFYASEISLPIFVDLENSQVQEIADLLVQLLQSETN